MISAHPCDKSDGKKRTDKNLTGKKHAVNTYVKAARKLEGAQAPVAPSVPSLHL